MKKFLDDTRFSDPKCLSYIASAMLPVAIANPGDWSGTAMALAGIIAWKAFLSKGTDNE